MISFTEYGTRLRALLAATLAIAAGLLASAGPAAAAAKHRRARGTVVVRISAPRRVAVSAVLAGPRHRRVLPKRASKRRQRYRLSVAVGRARIRAGTVVERGEVYRASVSRHRFRVRKGHRVTVRVRYRALPVATDLTAVTVSQSAVTLAWKGSGRHVRLRRAPGALAPRHVGGGVGVPVGHGRATDQGLQAATEYSYALFTRVRGHWAAPVTIQVGTASGGSTASFTAPPTTTIVRAGQPFGVSVSHGKVSVALPAAQPTPVLGAGFVLPISKRLAGGFVGKVASISPDGRTVTLVQAGLTEVFTTYNIDTPISGTTHLSSQLRRHGLRPAEEGGPCEPGGSVDVELDPSISWAGSFSASLVHSHFFFVSVPTGAQFSLQVDPTFELDQTITTSGKFSCDATLKHVVQTVTTDPVPISIVFDPDVSASVGGEAQISGVSERATVNLTADAEIGLSNHVSGGLTFNGAIAGESETEIGTSVEGSIGGRLTFGPGSGSSAAGAVAGISGALDPVKFSFEPAIDDSDTDVCLTSQLGGDASFGLNAEAWVGPLSAQASWNLMSKSWNYFPPIRLPSGCTDPPGPVHQPGPVHHPGHGGGSGPGGVTVSVRRCKTRYPLSPRPSTTPRVPAKLRLRDVPPGTRRLTAYDSVGSFVLGPPGYRCLGTVSFDGTSSLLVWPPGQPKPSGRHSSGSGLSLWQIPACLGCQVQLTCPYLGVLRRSARMYRVACPGEPPRGERVRRLGKRLAAFVDGPSVRGVGWPSGRGIRSSGLVGFQSRRRGAFESSCTLPVAQRAVCVQSAAAERYLAR